MGIIKNVDYDQLEVGMRIDLISFETQKREDSFKVTHVSKVEQYEGNANVYFRSDRFDSERQWSKHEYEFLQRENATLVVGQYINGNYTAFVKQEVVDAIKDPDPSKHDSFIKKVVIGNAEVVVGDLIEGVQIASIEHRNVDFDKNELNVFVAKNRHGACLAQTFVKHQDFSIVYGFRVMDESEIEWGESK